MTHLTSWQQRLNRVGSSTVRAARLETSEEAEGIPEHQADHGPGSTAPETSRRMANAAIRAGLQQAGRQDKRSAAGGGPVQLQRSRLLPTQQTTSSSASRGQRRCSSDS